MNKNFKNFKKLLKVLKQIIKYIGPNDKTEGISYYYLLILKDNMDSIIKLYKVNYFGSSLIICRTFIEGSINLLYSLTCSNAELIKIRKFNKLRRQREDFRSKSIGNIEIKIGIDPIFNTDFLNNDEYFKELQNKKGRIPKSYPNLTLYQKCDFIEKKLKGNTSGIFAFLLMYYEDLSEFTHDSIHGFTLTYGFHRINTKKNPYNVRKQMYKYQNGYSSPLFLIISTVFILFSMALELKYDNDTFKNSINNIINGK